MAGPEIRPYADGIRGSFLGPRFSSEYIEAYLRGQGFPYRRLHGAAFAEAVADLLADEKVVGLLQGRMEFGPRALGGRSILGDPRSTRMLSVMNLKIKFRESLIVVKPGLHRTVERSRARWQALAKLRQVAVKRNDDGDAHGFRVRDGKQSEQDAYQRAPLLKRIGHLAGVDSTEETSLGAGIEPQLTPGSKEPITE